MTTIDGSLTSASISGASTGHGAGRFLGIDDRAPDPTTEPPDDLRAERSPIGAIVLGIFVVLSFILVQIGASALLIVLDADLDVTGDLSLAEVAAIGAVQLAGILTITLLVLAGSMSWDRLGMRAPARSFAAGWWALLPVGLLVIGPSMAVALAGDDPVLARDVSPSLALGFVALAMLISANEELWFRGLLVDSLQSARRPWLTVFGAALLFGLPHVGDTTAHLVNALAVTLAVGIPFVVVRLRHGALAPLIVWHALVDAWAFLHTASVTPEGSPDPGEIVATLVLPSLVAIGYLVWFRRGVTR